jgi:SCP-2 sterol transfer family
LGSGPVVYNPRLPDTRQAVQHEMATKKQVKAKLQVMIDRLDGADEKWHDNLARALPGTKTIQIDVTDLECSYWTELTAGAMSELREGEAPKVDIRMRAKSDDLVAMVDGELGLMSSFMSGRVRVDASLSDLLALRKLA